MLVLLSIHTYGLRFAPDNLMRLTALQDWHNYPLHLLDEGKGRHGEVAHPGPPCYLLVGFVLNQWLPDFKACPLSFLLLRKKRKKQKKPTCPRGLLFIPVYPHGLLSYHFSISIPANTGGCCCLGKSASKSYLCGLG